MTKVFRGKGGVWDPEQAKIIAEFSKGDTPEDLGTFTTADAALIARLEKMGYKGEPVETEPAAVVATEPERQADPDKDQLAGTEPTTEPVTEPVETEPAATGGGRRRRSEA